MREILHSFEDEFARYKALGEGALAQVEERHLSTLGPNRGNSLAILVWHIGGNLASRFTNFLTTDGEKPWRQRDEEFVSRSVTREQLNEQWEHGWGVLRGTLAYLTDDDLGRTIRIRGQEMSVRDALVRSLAHLTYHVGQMVYLAKAITGADWKYLSIPPGQSAAYNANPTGEHAGDHAKRLSQLTDPDGTASPSTP